ncbi:hypothetical protein [Microvirga antarctica]|uniref:hypothetical protein n=1 Tax=Microvirga antarctica TaxID=2819233 RepID=UPI001B305216|nr:hypothetical protein [Microvirga antarctica]
MDESSRLDPMVFPPFTNREAWEDGIVLIDENDDPIDLSVPGAHVQIELWSKSPERSVLAAKTGEPALTVTPGRIDWLFAATQTRALKPGTYNIGCVFREPNGPTHQLLVGTVKVRKGYIS